MKRIYILLLFSIFITINVSCNKFLDVDPKGKVLLSNVTDYDLFLNSIDLTSSGAWELNFLGDDVDKINLPQTPDVESLIYLWASQFSTDVLKPPIFWGKHYANIYRYNAVINKIDGAGNGTENEKNRIKAEALLGRAFEYFYLINLFAKPYDAATANSDLGVPFITSTNITEETPPRSSVAEIYKHIFDDIAAALPYLPADNSANNTRGSIRAAHGVLARIYYYMGQLDDANTEALAALGNIPSAILDYNTVTAQSYPDMALRRNEIYARYSTNIIGRDYPTIELMKMFDPNDIRFSLFLIGEVDFDFKERGVVYFTQSGADVNFGISEEEMRLIIAENEAVNGSVDDALTQLELIRKFRFKPEHYKPLSATDKSEALDLVLRERKFELAYRGLRWFDMRRLVQQEKMPTVFRTLQDSTVVAELAPSRAGYTLEIPLSVIYFNPDMPLNKE